MASTLDNTLGVFFITSVVTSALYGAGMLQGWFYFRKYKNSDRRAIQALVGFVLVCDTVQQIFVCVSTYRYLVTLHNDQLAALRLEKTLFVVVFIGDAIGFAVQTFYCWRIWMVCRNFIIPAFIWLTCLATIILYYIYDVIGLGYNSIPDLLQPEEANLSMAGASMNAVSDILITLAVIFLLHSSKTSCRRTTDMVNRLIIFTFSTAIPTSLCAILAVIFLRALPDTFWYMGMYPLMHRFYTNCLLVTLNSRKYISHTADNTYGGLSISLKTLNGPGPSFVMNQGTKPHGSISVHVDRSITRDGYGTAEPEDIYGPEKSQSTVV